jgi:hypothetical protein
LKLIPALIPYSNCENALKEIIKNNKLSFFNSFFF